jgi:aminoglycoside 2'-N-acetyltransferase I
VVEILSFPEAEVPGALRLQVVALQDDAWPSFRPGGLEPRHDPALRPVSMLLVEDGRVRAALDILSKPVVHRGEAFAASGLSTVVTDRAERLKGYGKRLVEAAREAMRESGADLAIFTCDTPLAPFYEAADFDILPGAVLVGGTPADPLPSDSFDKVTLACFFTPRATAHAADFEAARIGLHPGKIDRLW